MMNLKHLSFSVLFTTALWVLPFVAGHDGEDHAIDIPTQAEGVTHAVGSLFFAGDLRTGGVVLVDAKTSFVTMAVPAATAPGVKANLGMDYNPNLGLLFVASIGPALGFNTSMTVYDIFTSTTVAECTGGMLVNDVFATDEYAYFTDSLAPVLHRLDIGALPECEVDTIPLPEPQFASEPGVFKANGLYPYADGFLVAHSAMNTIFWIDPSNATNFQMIFPQGSLVGADGIDLVTMRRKKGELTPRKKPLLYVAQNALDQVSVWKLRINSEDGSVEYSSKRNITSSTFAVPATVAVSPMEGILVTANLNSVAAPVLEPLPEGTNLTVSVIKL